MTRAVSFHEDAQREFDEATDFYAMERVSLGRAFVEAVERTVDRVREGDCSRARWPAPLLLERPSLKTQP